MKLGLIISASMWLCVLSVIFLSGCSFQVEVGYHGQTGRDNRTQTQLVKGGKKVRAQQVGTDSY